MADQPTSRTEDMSVREQYRVPQRPPLPFRMFAVMLAFPIACLILWRVFPDSTVTVALFFVSVFAAVAFGVFRVLSSRRLSQPPGDTRSG